MSKSRSKAFTSTFIGIWNAIWGCGVVACLSPTRLLNVQTICPTSSQICVQLDAQPLMRSVFINPHAINALVLFYRAPGTSTFVLLYLRDDCIHTPFRVFPKFIWFAESNPYQSSFWGRRQKLKRIFFSVRLTVKYQFMMPSLSTIHILLLYF